MAIDVDVSSAMKGTTMTVTIHARRVWLLKARVLIGCSMLRLAAWVIGCGIVVSTADE